MHHEEATEDESRPGSDSHAAGWGTTWLFVPADRPDRVEKALASDADVVILDLEDGVAAAGKVSARDTVRGLEHLDADRRRVVVRVNAEGTPWHDDDVSLVTGLSLAVMVPKAEPGDSLRSVASRSQAPVVGLIETARGVLGCAQVAEQVDRLALGNVDLAAELRVSPADRQALAAVRAHLVLASAAHGLPAPIDGVTTTFSDPGLALDDASQAAATGFSAKLCIHPRQLGPVRRGFAPSDDDVRWATRVLDAAGEAGHDGAINVDGVMVDAPVVERARWILRRAAPGT